MDYTDEQIAVFESNRKHVNVESGPGAGKTSTVVGTIRSRMQRGVPAESIVAFTFTRRAGKELCDRLGKDSRGMWIGTFHSVALDLIRRFRPEARVISTAEASILLKEAGRRTGLYDGTKWKHKGESGWEDTLEKSRLDHFFGRKTEVKLRPVYESLLRTGGDLDYLGCLLEACKILQENPEAMGDIRLVIVDEAQDTDELQWHMVDLIMGDRADGIYVGDLKQNLYNWRNARPDIFSNRPRSLKLRLSRSFRCTKPVMDAANNLIAKNPEGFLPIVSTKDGEPVMVKEWDATTATKFFLDLFYSPREIAILCRSNREVKAIQEALDIDDIPVYHEPMTEDHSMIYATLLATSRPDSPAAMGMFREINKKCLGLRDVVPLQLASSRDPHEKAFGKAILSGEKSTVFDVLGDLKDYFPESSYKWWMKEYSGHKVIDAVRDFSMREEGGGAIDGVVVQTIHQSKGLEYPVVILPSVIQGQFPSKRSMAKEESLEDERRVFFVAMTRSVERLAILTSFSNVSQFITEAGLYVEHQGFGDRQGVSAFDSSSLSRGETDTPW